MLKLWRKCADIIDQVYKAYEPLAAKEKEKPMSLQYRLKYSEIYRHEAYGDLPLYGGQKCASVVEKTLAVLDLKKGNKGLAKMLESQRALPEIWVEALKGVQEWEVKDLVWE